MIYACVVDLSFSMADKAPLNELVFDDPNANASMTIQLHLVTNHDPFNRRGHSVNWSIQEPDHQAYRGRKFHPSRYAQVNT